MNVKLTGLKKTRILNSDDVFGIMQKMLHRENKIDSQKDQERGKKEGKKEGEERGKKEREIEMAKGMLLKGININDIADISGLSKAQITKLSKTGTSSFNC